MEQVPQWLAAAVHAAGMTCFAEGLEPKQLKRSPTPEDSAADYVPLLPLH